MYVEKPDGRSRKSAQTACWYILDTLTKLIAPICSFTAEQVSDHYQKDKKESIHLQTFPVLEKLWEALCDRPTKFLPGVKAYMGAYCQTEEMVALLQALSEKAVVWDLLKDLRSAVLKAIEAQREKQIMRHSLEAKVTVYFDLEGGKLAALSDLYNMLERADQEVIDFFKEFFIVSQFVIAENDHGLDYSGIDGFSLKVEKAEGDKCPRCWQWDVTEHEHKLCTRCQKILG